MDEFLFGGIVPGSLVWVNDLINGNLTLPPVIPGNLTLLPDIPDALIPLPLPLPGVIRDNGFAVFNGKNYTTENE